MKLLVVSFLFFSSYSYACQFSISTVSYHLEPYYKNPTWTYTVTHPFVSDAVLSSVKDSQITISAPEGSVFPDTKAQSRQWFHSNYNYFERLNGSGKLDAGTYKIKREQLGEKTLFCEAKLEDQEILKPASNIKVQDLGSRIRISWIGGAYNLTWKPAQGPLPLYWIEYVSMTSTDPVKDLLENGNLVLEFDNQHPLQVNRASPYLPWNEVALESPRVIRKPQLKPGKYRVVIHSVLYQGFGMYPTGDESYAVSDDTFTVPQTLSF